MTKEKRKAITEILENIIYNENRYCAGYFDCKVTCIKKEDDLYTFKSYRYTEDTTEIYHDGQWEVEDMDRMVKKKLGGEDE